LSIMRPEGPLHRAPRPLIMWVGLVLMLALTAFVVAWLTAGALGMFATVARGSSAPDMTGGLAALIPALAAAAWQISNIFNQRHVERRDQIARGQVAPPFDPGPPPSAPSEPAINPHGGPGAP